MAQKTCNAPTYIRMLASFATLWFIGAETALADSAQDGTSLTDLSIEDLMEIEVTSVSKRGEKVEDAAAAIHVLTSEDIRRSGATNIPEALRLVPGLHVARLDTVRWAISARGFNGLFADKMLVLIDGRSIYTPLFSGVFWDSQDTLIEDIDRIEVIRGPGATLWGANAVNGVINVITKSAKDTTGGMVTGGGGSEERGFTSARFGKQISETTFARVYGKYFNRDESQSISGTHGVDDWDAVQGGFRLDSQVSANDYIRFQGDIFDGNNGVQLPIPLPIPPYSELKRYNLSQSGGNIIANWEHTFSETSVSNLQLYYDRSLRQEGFLEQSQDTADLDFQHRFQLGSMHDVMWGAGYRSVWDDLESVELVSYDPESRRSELVSGFVQDSIDFAENHGRFTVGSKFEHNSYTGFEYQPSARVLYRLAETSTVWTAVSRGVRTPSRSNDSVRLEVANFPNPNDPLGPLLAPTIFGNPNLSSESLVAYELGFRHEATKHISFDISAFFNSYDHLPSSEPGTPFLDDSRGVAQLVSPLITENRSQAESRGIELVINFSPATWWRLQTAYWFFTLDRTYDADSQDPERLRRPRNKGEPQHQAFLRSLIDLPYGLEFDAMLRFVDEMKVPKIPSYSSLDIRLGWEPAKHWDVSLVAQNLLEAQHLEYTDTQLGVNPSEIERGIYGKVTYKFGVCP